MEIVRNAGGTLVVQTTRTANETDDGIDPASTSSDGGATPPQTPPSQPAETRMLHPGEGGYDEALAEWDRQQNPDREPVVSTASGRQEAMTLVHAVATSPDHAV